MRGPDYKPQWNADAGITMNPPDPDFGWLYHDRFVRGHGVGLPTALEYTRLKPCRLSNGRCWYGFDPSMKYAVYEKKDTADSIRKHPRQ